MRDVAILLRASLHLGEPIFIWVEDAAFVFNQFGYASEELWKSNLIVNAQPGDLDRGGSHTNWSPISKGYARYPSTRRPRHTLYRSG